jgi:hypothetical protein
MSNIIVKQVIARAIAESDFRELLLTDPGTALVDLDLSPDEKMSLQSLSREALEALAFQGSSKITRPASLDNEK